MNDNDIIKALECCVNNDRCEECPINPNYGNYGYCTNLALTHALDLIRQQKAEIDRLETELQAMRSAANSLKMHYQTARADAIKAFADRLKQTRVDLDGIEMVAVGNIDAIAEQMTEE